MFNYIYNCFVVVELKVTELKKDYIGETEIYMDYIDKNLKHSNQNNTIGIIVCKSDNRFVIHYYSDKYIYQTIYLTFNEKIVEYS